jgi:hypothetical protein
MLHDVAASSGSWHVTRSGILLPQSAGTSKDSFVPGFARRCGILSPETGAWQSALNSTRLTHERPSIVVSTTVLLLPEFRQDLVEDDAVVFFNDLQ